MQRFLSLHATINCVHAGTKAYRKNLMKNPLQSTIEDLYDDYELLMAWVNKMQRIGTRDGTPKIHYSEQVPSRPYKLGSMEGRNEMLSPRTLNSHARLGCLRGVSHNHAIDYLLDKSIFPCAVPAEQTGNGMPFNNFNLARYVYYVAYCFADGLTVHHDEARRVLLYVFYGKYKSSSGCDAPVIRCIHASVQRQMLRLDVDSLSLDFQVLFKLMKENVDYEVFLTDKGAREAPLEYLVAWEKGFRTAARAKSLAIDK